MPWRYSPPRDPSSLLDPTNGFAADDVRRALGLSPVARVEDLERDVARLQRLLALYLDLFRGFDLQYGDNGTVTPSPRTGKMELNSSDDSILINTQPYGRAHVIDLTVASAPETCFEICAAPDMETAKVWVKHCAIVDNEEVCVTWQVNRCQDVGCAGTPSVGTP